MGDDVGSKCSSSSSESQANLIATSRLHIALFGVAVIGWAMFVLGCVGGPAWNADGSKILYGYHDAANSQSVIALYDLKSHKTRNIFSQPIPKEDKDDNFLLVPAWQADGKRALVWTITEAGGDGAHCVVASIPVDSGAPLHVFNLGKKASCTLAGAMPQFADKLYLGGEEQLTAINLSTGEINSTKIEGGPGQIAEHNGKLVYLRAVKRPAPTDQNREATEDGLESGSIDMKEPKLQPSFTLWEKDLQGSRPNDIVGAAWEPGGSRIAVIVKESDRDTVMLLDEQKGMLSTFKPDFGVKNLHLGIAVWSHDRKALYVSALSKGDKEGNYLYSLAEIPVDASAGRLTRIVDFNRENFDDSDQSDMLYFGMQVSLSPDGKTISAGTAALRDSVTEADRALFLVDVAHPEHRITRISPTKNARTR